MTTKGGYRPLSRLQQEMAEAYIEAQIGEAATALDDKARALRELVRLTKRCMDFLDRISGPGTGPSAAFAGA